MAKNTNETMEKVEHLERGMDCSSQESLAEPNAATVKKLKWKVDKRLSAILALMYIVNQIDRSNLGNASVLIIVPKH